MQDLDYSWTQLGLFGRNANQQQGGAISTISQYGKTYRRGIAAASNRSGFPGSPSKKSAEAKFQCHKRESGQEAGIRLERAGSHRLARTSVPRGISPRCSPKEENRIFLVADFGGQVGQKYFLSAVQSWNFETKGRLEREGKNCQGDVGWRCHIPLGILETGGRRVLESRGIAPSLLSKMGTGGNNVPIVLSRINCPQRHNRQVAVNGQKGCWWACRGGDRNL